MSANPISVPQQAASALYSAATGSNHPPEPLEPVLLGPRELAARLPLEHLALIARKDELIAGAARYPEVIEDDVTSGKVGDQILQLKRAAAAAMETKDVIKRPYLDACDVIQKFGASIAEPMTTLAKTLQARQTVFATQKADRERAKLRAVAEQAAADAAKAHAEAAAIEKEAADRLAAERRAAEDREQSRRAAAAARINAATGARRQALEEIEAEDRAIAEAALAELGATIPPDPEAARLREEAEQRQAEATRASAQASGPAAALSRTRGAGSVSSLRTSWKGEIVDIKAVDWAKLGPFVSVEHAQIALNRFVAAEGRELAGCAIAQVSTSQTR